MNTENTERMDNEKTTETAETAEPKATKTKKTKAPKEPKPPKAPKPPKEPKVTKARVTPALGPNASALFTDYKTLSIKDRNAFIENAREFERVEGVKASKSVAAALTVGTRVRVIGGSAKYFGKEGTITEARRVRIFVQLDGTEKSVYLFASDVATLEELSSETDAEETVAQAV